MTTDVLTTIEELFETERDAYENGYKEGAAVAFGIIGMFEAINNLQADLFWEEVDREQKELDRRSYEAMMIDRDAWRYTKDE